MYVMNRMMAVPRDRMRRPCSELSTGSRAPSFASKFFGDKFSISEA